jgi:hypothetical protein
MQSSWTPGISRGDHRPERSLDRGSDRRCLNKTACRRAVLERFGASAGISSLSRTLLIEPPLADEIAFAIDGTVWDAPSVEAPIVNGSGRISGLTKTAAQQLAAVLKSGPLPATLKLKSQRYVSPS